MFLLINQWQVNVYEAIAYFSPKSLLSDNRTLLSTMIHLLLVYLMSTFRSSDIIVVLRTVICSRAYVGKKVHCGAFYKMNGFLYRKYDSNLVVEYLVTRLKKTRLDRFKMYWDVSDTFTLPDTYIRTALTPVIKCLHLCFKEPPVIFLLFQ